VKGEKGWLRRSPEHKEKKGRGERVVVMVIGGTGQGGAEKGGKGKAVRETLLRHAIRKNMEGNAKKNSYSPKGNA